MSKILDIASRLVGIPYLENGCSRKGADCFGLVLLFLEELGVQGLVEAYRELRNLDQEKLFEYTDMVEVKSIREGDLLLFSELGTEVNHLGIFIGCNKMLHSSALCGKSRVVSLDPRMRRFIMGACRVKGL